MPVLIEFFNWWLRQIRSLPIGRRRRPGEQPDAVIVTVDELRLDPELAASGSVLIRRDGKAISSTPLSLPRRHLTPAVPATPPTLRTGLRLPPGMVLHREVTLPSAAARDLSAMLAFEMDRLTPFDAAELLWSTGPARHSANRDFKKFSLLLVLRRPVEALLAALGQAGLRPSFLECENGRIELRQGPAPAHFQRRALWLLCAGLALACLAVPVLRQQAALNNAGQQIAALAPALRETRALRTRLAAAAAAQAAITAAQQQGDTLRSLAVLTRALPDGTWLSDLTLKDGDLTIDGQSADAAALIAVLAATPAFHDPRFVAPVTRAINGDADLFSINATVTP